jgi:hypothetical protein
MNDYQQYIKSFLVTGNFTNNIDDMGNVNLNTSGSSANQTFIAVELSNNNYDDSKIISLYNTTI